MLIEENFSLKNHNTFQLDVQASFRAAVNSPEQLSELFQMKKFKTVKKLILGGGSNVLFTRNYLGMVVHMAIAGAQVEEESEDAVLVSFGAGELWHQCVLWAVENGFGGIENLALIPGTAGAAPIQNIGAYGVEIKEVFHSLEAYEVKTGKLVRFFNEDCKFAYRYSVFKGAQKGNYVITRIFLRLSKKPVFNIQYGQIRQTLDEMGVNELSLSAVSQAVINIRQSKLPDPAEIGNAGSFFKNPIVESDYFESLKAAFENIPGFVVDEQHTKVPAAWLIEHCGWKGKRFGAVGVHDRQALVLVHYGGGNGRDLVKLSKDIQQSVFQTFGVELEPEVNII